MAPTVVLISGANRGLGKGLLEFYLAKPNHLVIAANRDPEHSSSKSLNSLPKGVDTRLIIVKVDASIESDPFAAVKSLVSQGIDHIDLVIANAGISFIYPKVSEVKITDIQAHMVPNVYGVVSLFQATLPLLYKSASPKWATMGSGGAFLEHIIYTLIRNQPSVPNAAYAPSKVAVHWLTKRINAEEKHITAFVINPGWVQTDMGDNAAKLMGAEKAPVTLEESIQGMGELIEKATKESHGGKLWDYDGKHVPW